MQFPRFLLFLLKCKRRISFKNGYNEKLLSQENFNILHRIIDTNPNPIFYKDKMGVYRECNKAFEEYLGLKKEEIIGHTFSDTNSKVIEDINNKSQMELLKNNEKQTCEVQVKYIDGSIHDVIFKQDITENEGGLVGTIIDITEKKLSERRVSRIIKLKETMLEINRFIIEVNDITKLCNLVLEKITSAMDNADLGCVLILDNEENLRMVSSKGYDSEQVRNFSINLKDSFYVIVSPERAQKAFIINDIQSMKWDKYRRPLESKDEVMVESSINTPILLDGKLYGFINIDSTQNNTFDESDLEVMDYVKNQIEMAISKYKLYEETMYLSRYDKLSNVFNRRHFEELFEARIKEAIKPEEKIFVVIFDIDGLKVVNDTYGHLLGDELIKALPKCLKSHIGQSDILARFGGDEFIAVFFGIELEELIEKLENINKDFSKTSISFEKINAICSFSYGISEFPQDGDSYNKLIKVADKNMYYYKKEIKH